MSRAIVTLLGLILLASCGTTATDRGLSGAAIGAGVGAAAGAATGSSVIGGAVLGGAAGGATGVLTNSRQFDLGQTVWKR